METPGKFVLQGPVPVSGTCRFCEEAFTKMAPRSVKNPTCCAKEECQKKRRNEKSAKFNSKKRRSRYAGGH